MFGPLSQLEYNFHGCFVKSLTTTYGPLYSDGSPCGVGTPCITAFVGDGGYAPNLLVYRDDPLRPTDPVTSVTVGTATHTYAGHQNTYVRWISFTTRSGKRHEPNTSQIPDCDNAISLNPTSTTFSAPSEGLALVALGGCTFIEGDGGIYISGLTFYWGAREWTCRVCRLFVSAYSSAHGCCTSVLAWGQYVGAAPGGTWLIWLPFRRP